jgi:hypothetical protein
MTQDEELDALERDLIAILEDLRASYERTAKPYVDLLVRLRSIRTPPRVVIPLNRSCDFRPPETLR